MSFNLLEILEKLSEEHLQKALTIRKEIGDKGGEASTYGNLGCVFHALGDYAKAKNVTKEHF